MDFKKPIFLINLCDENELLKLPGIGDKISKRIIAEREEKVFCSIDDLMGVKGIGEAKIEKILKQFDVIFFSFRRNVETESFSETESVSTLMSTDDEENGDNDIDISSKLFSNDSDQRRFKNIFKSIESSEIIKQFQIAHIINKLIAEYATGVIGHCEKCDDEILILAQDAEIDGKTIYFHYCQQCIDSGIILSTLCGCDIATCDECAQFIVPDDYDECGNCKRPFACCHALEAECELCELEVCDRCDWLIPAENDCQLCGRFVCGRCWVSEWYHCTGCYYQYDIECKKCKNKYVLDEEGYLGRGLAHSYCLDDGESEMAQCSFEECDVFICTRCYKEEGNVLRTDNKGMFLVACTDHKNDIY